MAKSPSRSRSPSVACSGGSAVGIASYTGRTTLFDWRIGRAFCFADKDPSVYHIVLFPAGAPRELVEAKGDRQLELLWNAVEAAEHRKDSQVCRHWVAALPDEDEVTLEDRIELARTFAEKYPVSWGLGVQLDIHAPKIDAAGEASNWHVHMLLTPRRFLRDPLQPERYFEEKKPRDLDPVVRSGHVVEALPLNRLWRDHQNEFFRARGYETRVDPNGVISQIHLGPKRTWAYRAMSETSELQERIEANRQASHDPSAILEALTRYEATFNDWDLQRFLDKNLKGEPAEEIAAVRKAVMESPELVRLYDRQTGASANRYTTRTVRDQERAAMAAAAALANDPGGQVSASSAWAAAAERKLRPGDQAVAFDYAVGGGRLKLIEGRAGTGKSYTLAAIRDAHERDGRRVIGLAPTNAVANDMGADGFRKFGTLHSELFKLKNGLTRWDQNTVVMVDEAAMVGAVITGELLVQAQRAGVKLILVGDDRQLSSVERGGLFSELLSAERMRGRPPPELTDVVRQQDDWQRQAARDLAEYRFAKALTAFDVGGAITWTDRGSEARAALVAAWARDCAASPEESQFVFAYTNDDVDALNAELRQIRRSRGELRGPDVTFQTARGSVDSGEEKRFETFAEGDRVQITKTDREPRLYNGNVGTITRIDQVTGEITALIDGKPGRQVTWNAHMFQGFRLGYAGTIYKGQGKTLDRTYLYHTNHWKASPSYVALTRQRKSAQIFVARETAPTLEELARQMRRDDHSFASLEWDTAEERNLDTLAEGRARFEERRSQFQRGKQRFLEGYAAHEQDRRMAAVRDWVRDWYRLARDFYQALPALDRDASYDQARTDLLKHAHALDDEKSPVRQMLHERPELAVVPPEQGDELGRTAEQALRFAVRQSPSSQAVTGIVTYAETEQRARVQEEKSRADREARDLALRQHGRIDTRG